MFCSCVFWVRGMSLIQVSGIPICSYDVVSSCLMPHASFELVYSACLRLDVVVWSSALRHRDTLLSLAVSLNHLYNYNCWESWKFIVSQPCLKNSITIILYNLIHLFIYSYFIWLAACPGRTDGDYNGIASQPYMWTMLYVASYACQQRLCSASGGRAS